MFGFCQPNEQTLDYRSVYSRACQHHRFHFGPLSLPFHSYESVLLFACAVDANPGLSAVIPARKCCRLRGIGLSAVPSIDSAIGQFTSSLSMVLASVKLDDDLRDDRTWRVRFGRWLFARKINKAFDYFRSLDEEFPSVLYGHIHAHLALEKNGCEVPLDEYASATARSFAYVFGLMARLPEMRTRAEVLSDLGREIGTAIVTFDCAADFYHDKKYGHFNPLRSEEQIASALRMSREALQRGTRLCRDAFGENSLSAYILRSMTERCAASKCEAATCESERDALEMLGLAIPRRGVYLRSACGDCLGVPACCCLFVACGCRSCLKDCNTVTVKEDKSCC